MRNQEAARYARWAAFTAGAIALVVAGVYSKRAIQAARSRHAAPAVVPATVQQQSAEFKFTKMEQDRAVFTIRASTATRFKEGDRSLLKDVWITIYGRAGDRNDNIHTRECSYEPKSGDVHCEGEVNIDIQGVNPASGKPADKELEVRTSNLSFNRDTGEASTPAKVDFRSPQGHGTAVGVSYSTATANLRLERAVEIEVTPGDGRANQPGASGAGIVPGAPVTATGSSLELRRNERRVVLNGPAVMKQGARELTAETISIELDSTFHAQHVIAEGHPAVKSTENGGAMAVTADKFEGFLSPAGWVQRIVAAGDVRGNRSGKSGNDRMTAAQAEIAMQPERNLVREMMLRGGVALESQQDGVSRMLKTEALLLKFGAGAQPDQQKIESAETLAPATIETKTPEETTALRAKKFVTQFGSSGRLEKLLGHSGVEVRREIGRGAPQVSSSAELVATFAANGEWDTLDQRGNVRFQQAENRASADRAKIVRSTDLIALDGSPVVSDTTSRTTAGSVTINQKSGEIKASPNVVSTYDAKSQSGGGQSGAGPSGAMNLGSGPAHISADSLSGSTASGHVVYAGHARLWQGESVLDANRIEVWREDKKLQATGNVVAVFPQASSSFPGGPGITVGPPPGQSTVAKKSSEKPGNDASPVGSTLWTIRSPILTYWDDRATALLEDGVIATSRQGEMTSRKLTVYLFQGSFPSSSLGVGFTGRGQVNRFVAEDHVVIRQGDRRATAERALYTAPDQKFVLSGGEPTISDASSDTTTGHSLTFFVANDTILIDSQEGSRTLTKHRVEK